MKTASASAQSTSSSAADRSSRRRSALAAVIAAILTAVLPLEPALGAKRSDQVPRRVRMDVHWGETRNREAYRVDMQRAIVTALQEKECFAYILEGDDVKGELVLEVQLNDFSTEQEYDSPDTLLPGQGEEHNLISARVSVNLDFWLRPEGKDDVEILGGHFFREVIREPVSPTDDVELRALNDLIIDAGRWVARDLCDRRTRLKSKVVEFLGEPAPDATPR
jgi:hypothetical protein